MGNINYLRVILGGIVGGIVAATLDWFFNGVLLFRLWLETPIMLNRPGAFTEPVAGLVGLFLLCSDCVLSRTRSWEPLQSPRPVAA